MSHLPHENRNVRGYDGPEYEIPEVCAHPFCDVTGRVNLEKHELWPRSFLRGQPITHVQLWDGTIVGNQVYLCNAFQNGHHQAITENEARIRWSPAYGNFGWWEGTTEYALKWQPPLYGSEKDPNAKHPLDGETPRVSAPRLAETLTEPYSDVHAVGGHERFELPVQSLHATPGLPCALCKRVIPDPSKKKEPAKKRQTLSIRCPKEREEDGVELLTDMLAQGEEILRPGEKARPMYFTLADMLGLFLLNHKEILE